MMGPLVLSASMLQTTYQIESIALTRLSHLFKLGTTTTMQCLGISIQFFQLRKIGCNDYSSTYNEFINFVDNFQLQDLHFFGAPYLYFGNGQVVDRSRLKRFFIPIGFGSWPARYV